MVLKNEPTYVKKFKCSNRYCTDTCCHGFDIELDDKSLDVYNNFTGELKDLVQEGVFHRNRKYYIRSEDGRCFFLNDDNLCRLQIIGGESALCHTCRIYPRFMFERNNVAYTGLALSCPTAFNLIMDSNELSYPFYSLDDNKNIATLASSIENECFFTDKVMNLFLKLNKREFDLDDCFHMCSNECTIFENALSSKDILNLCRYFYFRYRDEDNDWKNISYWFVALVSMLINNKIITRCEIYKVAKEIEHSDTNISFLKIDYSF